MNSDRARWFIALGLALALHVAAILLLYSLPFVAAAPAEDRKPVAVHLVLPPETPEAKDPHYFSELPPNRADLAPKNPEFLSNVTSRARDRAPGGGADLPRMKGDGDAPAVNMEKNGAPSSAPSPPATETEKTPISQTAKTPEDGLQKQQMKTVEDLFSSPKPIEPVIARQMSKDELHGNPGSGGSDIHQPEMDNPDGNADLFGDISLSTTAWEYAPWLQDFERKVMRGWFAPPAYSYGLLKEGGWGLFRVEVSRSGKMLRLDLLDQQGHPALIRNAQSALHNAAPLNPLPADFPESTLVVRVRMTYPRIPSR